MRITFYLTLVLLLQNFVSNSQGILIEQIKEIEINEYRHAKDVFGKKDFDTVRFPIPGYKGRLDFYNSYRITKKEEGFVLEARYIADDENLTIGRLGYFLREFIDEITSKPFSYMDYLELRTREYDPELVKYAPIAIIDTILIQNLCSGVNYVINDKDEYKSKFIPLFDSTFIKNNADQIIFELMKDNMDKSLRANVADRIKKEILNWDNYNIKSKYFEMFPFTDSKVVIKITTYDGIRIHNYGLMANGIEGYLLPWHFFYKTSRHEELSLSVAEILPDFSFSKNKLMGLNENEDYLRGVIYFLAYKKLREIKFN